MSVFSEDREGCYWSVNSGIWEALVWSLFTGLTEVNFNAASGTECCRQGLSSSPQAPVLSEAPRSPPTRENDAPPL